MAKNRFKNVSREERFISYFSLVPYTIKILQHFVEMTQEFTGDSYIKNFFHQMQNQLNAKMLQIMNICEKKSRLDFRRDLEGDEVLAIGSIMSELVNLDSIVTAEDEIIELIRKYRRQEPGYKKQLLQQFNENLILKKGNLVILKDDLFYSIKHTPDFLQCSRCWHCFQSVENIIYAWPEPGEPNFGEQGEYRFCQTCLEKVGFEFKNQTLQHEKNS